MLNLKSVRLKSYCSHVQSVSIAYTKTNTPE